MATTEVSPAGIVAVGKTKVGFFAGTLASSTAISLASDVGHAGFLNIGFYIPGTLGDWNPAVAQNKTSDPRLSSAVNYESLGAATWSIPDITYVEDVTGAGTGVAKGLLVEGTAGVMLVRYGLSAPTDWATTQRAYAFPCLLGKRFVVTSQSDEGGKFAYRQVVAVTGAAVEDTAITA